MQWILLTPLIDYETNFKREKAILKGKVILSILMIFFNAVHHAVTVSSTVTYEWVFLFLWVCLCLGYESPDSVRSTRGFVCTVVSDKLGWEGSQVTIPVTLPHGISEQ